MFDTVGAGTTSLDVSHVQLGTPFPPGLPLDVDEIIPGSVTVEDTTTSIPDASTLFLLGSACLVGLAGLRRKLDR
jgi:hypothetical protein